MIEGKYYFILKNQHLLQKVIQTISQFFTLPLEVPHSRSSKKQTYQNLFPLVQYPMNSRNQGKYSMLLVCNNRIILSLSPTRKITTVPSLGQLQATPRSRAPNPNCLATSHSLQQTKVA